MTTSYNTFCDDFYVDMFVNTQLELPEERDTLLTFFERIQKQFPHMSHFYRRDNGDFCLESDRESGSYSWVAIEMDRLSSGFVNPANINQPKTLHKAVLDLAPHMLGLSYLDISSLDLGFAMDFDYCGNQNEIIAEALYANSPFTSLLDVPNTKPISFSPGFIISLNDSCSVQAKLTIESNSSVYEIKTQKFKESEPITLYFTVRQYPTPSKKFEALESYDQQFQVLEEFMNAKIIPDFVKPLNNTIAQRR